MTVIDLVTNKINITDPGADSEQERADIAYLAAQPQWASLRNWLARQSVDFFGAAGVATKDEAYILVRLGKYIVDTLNEIEKFAPTVEEKAKTDSFDDQDIASSVLPGHPTDGLPLAPLDE